MDSKFPPLPRTREARGFALIVTLSLMILLTVIAVGLLTLSSISLRSSSVGSAGATARANARMAMMIAIGELQKYAGPDQRVTATAGMEDDSYPNPQWMGVWNTEIDKKSPDAMKWLVSGDNLKPQIDSLDAKNSALFASVPKSDPSRKELRAQLVNVQGEKFNGRFGYWVGDEGVKARVDVSSPIEKIPSNEVARKTARALAPQEAGLLKFDSDPMWAKFDPAQSFDRSSLISLGTVAVATTGSLAPREVPKHYFNDLTTGGVGLPVNVKGGGIKTDLSVLFDKSMETKAAMLQRYMGTVPQRDATLGSFQTTTGVTDPKKYFLSENLSKNGTSKVGPNWGNLWSYAKLWENVTANKSRLVGGIPRPSSDLRMDNWAPYANQSGGEWANDPQHGNSTIGPVLSLLQFTVRLSAVGPFVGTAASPPIGKYYIPRLEIKPVIGLWNPYNVTLNSSSYQINWSLAPYMRFAHNKPPSGAPDIHEIWLREYWNTGRTAANGVTLPVEGSQGGGYFNLETNSITLAPGEMRLFSINTQEPLAGAGQANRLVSTWGENGGFYMPIKRSQDHPTDPNQKKGADLRVPAGNDIWFGSMVLQDTQAETQEVLEWAPGVGTRKHLKDTYGSDLATSATASWVTLKSGDLSLARCSNLWNGGTDQKMGTPVNNNQKYFVPEQVRHSQYTNADTTRKYTIDALGMGDVGHLATWRMIVRNATDGQSSVTTTAANQGLRGWIDSNPRAMAGSPRFDGSRINGTKVEGWNFISNFTGERNDYPNVMGEGRGKGGSRGLVAEGNLGEIEPPGEMVGGSFVGYGGGGSTEATGGVSNVIIYDVPRGPLTSVGQLQHAQLSRYNFEPGFVVGNSYANLRIPPAQTFVEDFAKDFGSSGAPGFRLVDTSYEVNDRLWDSVFFSTLAPDYVMGSSYSELDMKSLADGSKQLPNPRMLVTPLPGDVSLEAIVNDAADRAPEALAARIGIKGAFNVHSTSKAAWKAILSSLGSSDMPVVPLSATATTTDWKEMPGIRFNRFSYPGSVVPFEADPLGDTDAFWRGWRKLSDKELDTLAGEIVKEVKQRGPFHSMAEFVNRNPKGTVAQQQKGTLQAALDRTLNSSLPDETGKLAQKPDGAQFAGTPGDARQSAGYPGNILQGDILQSLAPILQVRSDYFRIRTCGEALDKNGKVVAKVWCEAFVQRTGDYVSNEEKAEIPFLELKNEVNKTFGRHFELVSFRWLAQSEI